MSQPAQVTPAATERAGLGAPTAALVIVLLLIDGLHFVFARALRDYLPPVTSAFFVIAIAAVELAVFAAWQGRLRLATFRQHWRFFTAIGALIGTSTAMTYVSVTYIDPGTASLLVQTTTIFGLLLGVVWLGERLSRRQVVGAAVCLLGVAIITFQPGDYLRLGALLIIGSSVFYALHAAIVKRYGGGLDFLEFFVWRVVSVAGFLFFVAAALGPLQWPTPTAWLILIIAGTVDVVISRALYYLVLRRVKVSVHSLILTASPVVAIIWSYILFQSVPTARELLGGVAVLAGVMLVTTARKPGA
jgi:drug/metabolite transporter (DMT)-like permease